MMEIKNGEKTINVPGWWSCRYCYNRNYYCKYLLVRSVIINRLQERSLTQGLLFYIYWISI